jgi:DNA-binding NarL/FixJ family response regulator
MPRLNGIDASRILKRLMPATPIVMFTTFTNPFIKEAALAAGVQAVVDKSEGATTPLEVFSNCGRVNCHLARPRQR